jgi:hypothetical protein
MRTSIEIHFAAKTRGKDLSIEEVDQLLFKRALTPISSHPKIAVAAAAFAANKTCLKMLAARHRLGVFLPCYKMCVCVLLPDKNRKIFLRGRHTSRNTKIESGKTASCLEEYMREEKKTFQIS